VEAQSTSDTLPLNLFDDVSVSATLDHLEYSLPGMVTWVGSVDGYEGSLAILVAGDDGVVSGNVSFDDQIFQVRYVSPGVHAIYQIDQSQFPDDPGIEPPVPDLSDSALEPQESLLISAQDDGSIIDVMLLYTDDARAGAGGTSAIQSLVNLAVSETNQIYANSAITQRIRLVYTGEVAYNETGDLSEDL